VRAAERAGAAPVSTSRCCRAPASRQQAGRDVHHVAHRALDADPVFDETLGDLADLAGRQQATAGQRENSSGHAGAAAPTTRPPGSRRVTGTFRSRQWDSALRIKLFHGAFLRAEGVNRDQLLDCLAGAVGGWPCGRRSPWCTSAAGLTVLV
jgi:hypothetical protein